MMRHFRSPFLSGYLAITLGLSPTLGLMPASANPQGGQVVGGSATIQGQGTSTVTVNQGSDRAIINWNTFNLGQGDLTRFVQPNASSIALNRVTGGLGPSQIFGTIQANGRVFLVNPNGVLFGQGAVIDTAGFLATTHDIKNDDFMAGRNNFTIPGNPGASIVNLGTITATSGGIAALVAPGVRNSGTIVADFGKVAMASANSGFTLDFYGDKLITLQVGDSVANQVIDVATNQPLSALVKNEGTLKANGGRVELTAVAARQVVDSVINNTGVIEANSVGTKNGMIVLGAATAASKGAGAPDQKVKIAGTISAAGKNAGEKGGKIQITGEGIALAGAKIDASGKAGGGKVLIGGDVGGGKGNAAVASIAQAALETTPVATASTVTVDAASTINASAIDSGNGGKVVVWSDQLTTFAGLIKATGGSLSGNGGFAEVSSKGKLAYSGRADLRAPFGSWGTLLLDPADFYIIPGESDNGVPLGASVMTDQEVQDQLGQANLVIATHDAENPSAQQHGDIFVYANVNWNSSNSLTLNAFRNIQFGSGSSLVNAPGSGAAIILRADSTGTGTGTVNFNSESLVSTSGPVSIFYNPASYTSPTIFNPYVSGQLTAYMLVNSVVDLQSIGNNLSGTYALGKDIVAPQTENSGANFDPIGGVSGQFAGLFDGQNHSISGLKIAPNDTQTNSIGLFAMIGLGGSVRDLTLRDITVTANAGFNGGNQFIGALAGQNAGLIDNVLVVSSEAFRSKVDGLDKTGVTAGGLVGQNGLFNSNQSSNAVAAGTISRSSADVDVSVGANNPCNSNDCGNGQNFAGGLVGQNNGTITAADFLPVPYFGGSNYLNANLQSHYEGGSFSLFGMTYALGNVSVGSHATGGGLVGQNNGVIENAFAMVNVMGAAGTAPAPNHPFDNTTRLGGLVGSNSGTIENVFAAGNVGSANTAYLTAGGIVGDNAGAISNAYAFVTVKAGDNSIVGGLAAENAPNDNNNNNCNGNGCFNGGIDNSASIIGSFAFGTFGDFTLGSVAAGNASVAGGLVGYNQGLLLGVFAGGDVSVGNNSVAGGLVGVQDQGGSIGAGFAIGSVQSIGPNSIIGGLVGANAGSISASGYGLPADPETESPKVVAGGVFGGSDSYIGGLVGINVAVAGDPLSGQILSSYVDPTIAGSGAGNVVGGLIGFNGGFADGNTGNGNSLVIADVSSGANSIVGAFAGVSAANSIVNYTFIGPPVTGNSNTNSLPALPGWIINPGCDAAICGALMTQVNLAPPSSDLGTQPPIITQVNPPQTTENNTNIIILTQPGDGVPPSGGTPPGNNNNNNNPPPPRTGPPPGAGIGRTLSEQQFSGVPPLNETRFLPGEVVVQISNTVSSDLIQKLIGELGLKILSSESIDSTGRTAFRLGTTGGRDIRAVIRALEKKQVVASAQPNYVFNLAQDLAQNPVQDVAPPPAGTPDATGSLPPSPELSSEQQADMAARTTLPAGDAAQYIIDKLRLGAVHTRSVGRNVTVAVIDSEIDTQHPDLLGVISEKFDATGTASSPHVHGTGMAGAIASKRRLLGIAPGVRILAVKAFDETSTSAEATSYQILKGLDWAIAKKVRIINMSFAGPRDLMVERSLQKAYDQGIVLIAAAGNAGPKSPPLYPAADVNVIAVSATDYADKPFKMANHGKYIAVAAPGVDVLVPAPKGAYQLTTGTSVAAAHVSGVAALLLESRPSLTPKDVRTILTSTARAINPKGKDDITGAGLVDPYQALTTSTARAVDSAPATRAPATH